MSVNEQIVALATQVVELYTQIAQNAAKSGEVKDMSSFDIKPVLVASTSSQEAIRERIDFYANKYGVSAEVMDKVVNCESGYNPTARGDRGLARGLAQIRSDYHPTVTDEQAFDVDFPLDFLAENLAKGRGHLWTCWRMLQ